jgi:site-specific recombinase XerD
MRTSRALSPLPTIDSCVSPLSRRITWCQVQRGAIMLVSATLGHADLKTTSVYAHARPGESSGRYLKTK